jgi:hypothetical protein
MIIKAITTMEIGVLIGVVFWVELSCFIILSKSSSHSSFCSIKKSISAEACHFPGLRWWARFIIRALKLIQLLRGKGKAP